MQLTHPLLKLPVTFCPDTLAAEVRALPASAWDPHPTGFVGNEAVRLVTPEGKAIDAIEGPMAATQHLRDCPYIMEVMSELGDVWGRSRLMSLAAGAEVPAHIDTHYYWRTHFRLHIPVITNPRVEFTCAGETVHMAAGECWLFDSFQRHEVQNKGTELRIHLVLDTVGGERLWDLIEAATDSSQTSTPQQLAPGTHRTDNLGFEQVNVGKVMSPWEIRGHLTFLAKHALPDPQLAPVMKRLDRFQSAWTAAWARFGTADEGLPTYRQLVATVRRDLNALDGSRIRVSNQMPLYYFLEQLVFTYAVFQPKGEHRPVLAGSGGEPLTP